MLNAEQIATVANQLDREVIKLVADVSKYATPNQVERDAIALLLAGMIAGRAEASISGEASQAHQLYEAGKSVGVTMHAELVKRMRARDRG